ncbi:alpha-xylosidase [Marinilactibacillus psychrotolerans]|uniref:alpha-D-xyloside xylohydrolase n=1 Tax=Marinilactibacillus psychrotolerans TaxID=191770 RepID=A0AAV3WRE9_9LACT|nr:alpha-xylosidase [Marinilactibacillus psychrotolerans]GEL66911.1 alpha-xylosidase [Marinilactibacillus psychrotolerans]GEQ35931.1 alpha-glucosidase [Marinilactibacillus psychrotolerans]SDC42735.1 alpha-D-xyloside xylohydrolase [Marinilactibacillus psychrotolerans]
MKFTEGYWLTKEGYTLNYPQETRDFRIDENGMELFLPYKKIERRGDTLNLGLTTLRFESPQEDIIKVRLTHHDKNTQKPDFSLFESKVQVDIDVEAEHFYRFKTGALEAVVPKEGDFKIEFRGHGKLLTSSKHKAQAEISSDDGKHYMREQLSLDPDEYVYGTGERFTPFIKNGQSIEIWNEDGGTGSEQSYKNIPFYLTNKGYGIFVNHPGKVDFEIGSENVSRTQFSVEGETLEYFIIYGPDMKSVLKKYTDLTGKPALPPAWSFGLWLSTSFTTDYREETVMHFIDEMQSRDIPFDVFHFDCFWMKEFEWCGFEWNKELFPDPGKMIKKIHEKGLKVCMWINPYIGQKAKVYKECKEKGYFIKSTDENVWQWDLWQAGQGIIDFTNPEAREWYKGQLKGLLELGVDSFKTDFGERIPTDAVYYDGSNPEKMHNYYAYLYNEVVFELLEELKGKGEAVVFARSASVGSQKFPVHWGGDNLSEYSSMAESLRGGLSFVLSGFGFWSHDIGGFEEEAEEDLYKRWTQFGLLSTHSRYHGNIEYRVPWNFGEEAALVSQKFSKLKNSLMPYIYSEAVETAKTGVPMMRPLVLEFSEDYTTHTIDKQYMFGKNLMVAPIFNDKGEAKFYLPEGTWTNYIDNSTLSGGKWYEKTYDYFNLPLMVRPNSLIIEGATNTTAAYDYSSNLIVHAFEITETVSESIYDINGNYVGKITITPKDDNYDVQAENLHKVKVLFRNRTIEGMEKNEYGSILNIKE